MRGTSTRRSSMEPVICPNCGGTISALYDVFEDARKKMPERMGEILDELLIDRICCRAIFMTSVNFYQLRNGTYHKQTLEEAKK